MTKVVISMTTIPSRLNKKTENTVRRVIETLHELTYSNYEIHLNIPEKHSRTKEPYSIPPWLQESEKLRIFRTEDFGPATKLIPTVLRLKEEVVIIVVDDDLEYERDFIESHLVKRKQYPDCAIGFAGLESVDPRICHYCTARNEDVEVRILEGYKTVSFLRHFFQEDLLDFFRKYETWDDDLLISSYLASKNIRRIAVSSGRETNNVPRADSYPVISMLKNELDGCNLERASNVNNRRDEMEKYLVQ